jgi:hypothetical protein
MAISKSRFAFFLASEGRWDAIKDRFASPCIYKTLVAPEGPVSAPGKRYCSHDVPRIDSLFPCRNILILRIIVRIHKMVKIIGSCHKGMVQIAR